MVKIFWVWDDDKSQKSGWQKSWNAFQVNNIDISEVSEEIEEYLEDDDVGQIALDVLENHESVYILAPVAGVELKDIDISVFDSTLTISGVRNKPKEFYEHDMEVKNQECFWGKFLRNVILPENLDFGDVRAVMENNLLVIHIPKIRFDSKNIKINRIES